MNCCFTRTRSAVLALCFMPFFVIASNHDDENAMEIIDFSTASDATLEEMLAELKNDEEENYKYFDYLREKLELNDEKEFIHAFIYLMDNYFILDEYYSNICFYNCDFISCFVELIKGDPKRAYEYWMKLSYLLKNYLKNVPKDYDFALASIVLHLGTQILDEDVFNEVRISHIDKIMLALDFATILDAHVYKIGENSIAFKNGLTITDMSVMGDFEEVLSQAFMSAYDVLPKNAQLNSIKKENPDSFKELVDGVDSETCLYAIARPGKSEERLREELQFFQLP